MIENCQRKWKSLAGDERATEDEAKNLQAWFQRAIAALKALLEQMLEDVDRSSGKEMLDLEQSWIEDRDGLQKLFYEKAAKLIVGATAAAPPVVVSRRTPTGRLIGRRIGAVQVQDSDKLRGDGKGKGVIIYSLDCIPGTEQNEACDHHDAVKSLYDYVVAFWASALGRFEFSEHHRDIFLSWGGERLDNDRAFKQLVAHEGLPSTSTREATKREEARFREEARNGCGEELFVLRGRVVGNYFQSGACLSSWYNGSAASEGVVVTTIDGQSY